ncbi:type IV pilus assembly protein PilM [Nitriliruptor alkaliphilus]|uniref:type IV pilus assembly protein PilM n=1 Tax=Nitriliruptor alkaliphilus TaxID=427918 RepID=UPI0006976CE2|nr:type IV pilus assembly protein PilM [Nitriliruptor alkaliphilus]
MGSSAVGIDIGTRTITLAEVKQVRGAATITNFGGVELPEDAVREGEIVDLSVVSRALSELLSSAKVGTKKVFLGVANQRVVVRQVDLPWMEPKELKASLRYQVQEFLPIPVEEAELDVHVVEEFTTEGGERFQRLLLVAGHRDMVASHVDAAVDAGLKPLGVDLNPFAVLRSMGRTSRIDTGNEVVIDVGAGVTDIVVHEAGTPTFVRILVLGGDDITSALASGLGISSQEAEARKRQLGIGGDPSDVAARIVSDRAEQFVDEIRSSLDYYQAQAGASRLSNVVLTGGGALLRGLAPRLEAALRLPVQIGSVFDRFPVKGTVYGPEDLAHVGPNLAVAVGLALGGLE